MQKFTITIGLLLAGLAVGACGDASPPAPPSPDASLAAQTCADCLPVSRVAVEWFRELEGLSVQDIVLDLTASGRERRRSARVVDLTELRDLATGLGMGQGFQDDVLDCDDDRILLDQPRCRMRQGEVLLTLFSPSVSGSAATIRLQRWGPGPGGPWWAAVYELKLERTEGGWAVVDHKLLTQS